MGELAKQVEELLNKEYERGLHYGLELGILALERVYVWLKSDKELVKPNGMDRIAQWVKTDLEILKEKRNA